MWNWILHYTEPVRWSHLLLHTQWTARTPHYPENGINNKYNPPSSCPTQSSHPIHGLKNTFQNWHFQHPVQVLCCGLLWNPSLGFQNTRFSVNASKNSPNPTTFCQADFLNSIFTPFSHIQKGSAIPFYNTLRRCAGVIRHECPMNYPRPPFSKN